jgi:hypothetical protein
MTQSGIAMGTLYLLDLHERWDGRNAITDFTDRMAF